jgi:hypothetical protein
MIGAMKKLVPAALLALAAAAAVAQERTVRFYGYAYELGSGRYLYAEAHERKYAGERWLGGVTRYLKPDGTELGRKTLDFGADPFVPAYRLEEQGYVEGITSAGDPVALMRQDKGGKAETETVKRDGLMAADSGFTNLLLAHFDELMGGGTLRFRIIAVSRFDTFKFKAKRVADATFDGKPAACFQSEVDSMLKLFAAPLQFCFDAATRRLVQFTGPVNVRDPATGKTYDVRIEYASKPPAGITLSKQSGSEPDF